MPGVTRLQLNRDWRVGLRYGRLGRMGVRPLRSRLYVECRVTVVTGNLLSACNGIYPLRHGGL